MTKRILFLFLDRVGENTKVTDLSQAQALVDCEPEGPKWEEVEGGREVRVNLLGMTAMGCKEG